VTAFAPFDEAELAIVRRAFARQMMAIANVQDERVEHALASVRPRHGGLSPGRSNRRRRSAIRPASIRTW